MAKAPVNITVTLNSGDSFLAVPLYADGPLTVRGNQRGVRLAVLFTEIHF